MKSLRHVCRHRETVVTHLPSERVSDGTIQLGPRSPEIRYRGKQRLSASVIIVHSGPGNPTANAISLPRTRQLTGALNVELGMGRMLFLPRRYRPPDKITRGHEIRLSPTMLEPKAGRPFLWPQTQEQRALKSGKYFVEPPSPCAGGDVCSRGLTDVGEGDAVRNVHVHLGSTEDARADLPSQSRQQGPNNVSRALYCAPQ